MRSIQPKFQPGRPGKLVHLKRWTRFFETFPVGPNRSRVLDRNIPEILVEWIAPLGTGFQNPISRHCDAGGQDSRLTRTLKKKIALNFTCHAIGNGRLLLFKHWKIFLNDSFDMLKVQTKKRTQKGKSTHFLLSLSLILNLIKVKLDTHSVLSILYFPALFIVYNTIKVSLFIRLLKQTKAKKNSSYLLIVRESKTSDFGAFVF